MYAGLFVWTLLSTILSKAYKYKYVATSYVPSYLGTVVGGRRGVENRSAGGGIRIFAPRGGKNFVLQEGGRGG